MTERDSPEKRAGKRLSLHPLSFEDALKALLETPPERKESQPKPPHQNGARPKG
jgi:hypothetical protein